MLTIPVNILTHIKQNPFVPQVLKKRVIFVPPPLFFKTWPPSLSGRVCERKKLSNLLKKFRIASLSYVK